MSPDAVVEVLRYAQAELRTVRLVLRDGSEVIGIPSSIDTHPTALEIFLHPVGDEETEIGVALTGVTYAEMV